MSKSVELFRFVYKRVSTSYSELIRFGRTSGAVEVHGVELVQDSTILTKPSRDSLRSMTNFYPCWPQAGR